MSGGQGGFALYYVLIIVAVAGSLIGMRQPVGTILKLALAWVAIFGIGFLIFSFRGEFAALGQRLKAEAFGSSVTEGTTLRIPIGDDGHFHVDATVNGHPVRFMVDSGASVTTISRAAAEASGVSLDGRRTVVQTAAGPSSAIQATANKLQVGSIARDDFPIDVNERDDMNLLGMNFLSTLTGWRVEGTFLVLQP